MMDIQLKNAVDIFRFVNNVFSFSTGLGKRREEANLFSPIQTFFPGRLQTVQGSAVLAPEQQRNPTTLQHLILRTF